MQRIICVQSVGKMYVCVQSMGKMYVCVCVCDRNQELNQELKNIIQLKRDSEPKINEQTNTVEEN